MELVYYITDVFTDKPFGGNQLAVFPRAQGIAEPMLQQIARELNFSETSFVYPPENPDNDCRLRIFTPAVEVPTAGHPTIGTAFILLSEGILLLRQQGKAVFEEKVGDITITFDHLEGTYRNIGMTQPLPVFGPVHTNLNTIASILSLPVEEIDERYPVQSVSCGNNFLFIPLKSHAGMADIKVRVDLLENHKSELDSTELYVFTTETLYPGSTTHGRMFAPRFGIPEDPVTGSASGPLGCYLVKHGLSDGHGIICEQGFEMGRPGIVYVGIENVAGKIETVKVSGNAVKISKGIFYV
ncbi:MAG: PhzF family phenazine biosynthesis protein [Bacteroidales bacterium]|nr:PhzF family phenazine biosynthesis protein [Bacteroidales bacterium]